MTKSIIHVHTQADKSTTAYVRFMWQTMQELAYAPELLKLHVHCIGPSAAEILKDLDRADVIIAENTKGGGSHGHGACIMSAFKMMNDGNIHIITDGDAFVVAKGWDNYVRKRIAEGVGIMGTTYEDLGGFSSGSDQVQTYKKVPTFTWAAMSSNYPWSLLNVMPDKAHRVAINSPLLSKIYNLPVGYSVFGEAAWQLPQFIYDNAMPYEGWRQLKPSKDAVVLKGLTDYHEEYHAEGVPFVVHHRGSIKHAYRGNKVSNAFFASVDRYLAEEKTRDPKWVGEAPHNSDTMFQLSFSFGVSVPSPIETSEVINAVPMVATASGWLKITLDGTAIRPRGNVTVSKFTLDYKSINLHHLRLEGTMSGLFEIEIPKSEPHCLTVRNTTNATIRFTHNGTIVGVLNPGAVQMLLVDIDAVIPMT